MWLWVKLLLGIQQLLPFFCVMLGVFVVFLGFICGKPSLSIYLSIHDIYIYIGLLVGILHLWGNWCHIELMCWFYCGKTQTRNHP